jgi:hypothetical protein
LPPIKNQEDVPLDGGVAEQTEDDGTGRLIRRQGRDSRSFNLVYSINYVAFVVMGMPLEKSQLKIFAYQVSVGGNEPKI